MRAVPTVARRIIGFFPLTFAPALVFVDEVLIAAPVPTQGWPGRVSELFSTSATLRSLFSSNAQSTRSELSEMLFVTEMGRSNTV